MHTPSSESLLSVFDRLPAIESTTGQPRHLGRLAIEDRRMVGNRRLWSSLYVTLRPGLTAYYDTVNAGHFLASSEAGGYRKWAEENNIARSVQLAFEMSAINGAPDGPILVLGTGSGFDTAIPAASFRQRKFIATEASPVASTNAGRLFETLRLDNAAVQNTDYQEYLKGVPDGSLGGVISNWALSGSLDPLDTLTTIYAKLAPDGLLAITESPGNRLPDEAYDQQGIARLLERRGDGIAPKIYFSDLGETLASIGYGIVASSRGIPDTSDTIIAAKSLEAQTVQAHEVLAYAQPWLDQSRRMVAGLFDQ